MGAFKPAALASLLVAAAAFSAPVGAIPETVYAFTGGAEYFVWREFDTTGSEIVEETGPRYFIGLDAENDVAGGWVYGLRLRLYGGEVDYDGQAEDLVTGVISDGVTTTTRYMGYSAMLDFVRPLGRSGIAYARNWSALFGLGVESWERDLQDTGNISGYVEKWTIPFAAVGLVYGGRSAGWYNQLGIRYPFSTDEEAHGAVLQPDPELGGYLRAGYRTPRHWDLGFYVDALRFGRSNPDNGFVQPESHQNTYGLNVRYWY